MGIACPCHLGQRATGALQYSLRLSKDGAGAPVAPLTLVGRLPCPPGPVFLRTCTQDELSCSSVSRPEPAGETHGEGKTGGHPTVGRVAR